MLNRIKLSDKTYEELMLEAAAQIPLHSGEWTNFNPSDPGITLLQNLTAFQLLQQEAIDDVPEPVQRKLLKLAGYTPRENRAAEVLVQVPARGGPILPEGWRLWSGEIPFETVSEVEMPPWGLAAVYGGRNGAYRDLTNLLSAPAEAIAYPFTREPAAGDALVCVLSGVPEVGEPLYLWFQAAEEELRTPFGDGHEIPVFSRVCWQYFTAAGWQDARWEDETVGFLRSGAVRLYLEKGLPRPLTDTPVQGCALRCLLETAEYDRAPRLRSLAVHLFPMQQRQTSFQCLTAPGGAAVELRGRLPKQGELLVFGRETADGPYYLYREGGNPQGRFYQQAETLLGIELTFADPPCGCSDGVRALCCDSESLYQRDLGPVYGYDGQAIPLPEGALPESVLLAVESEGAYTFLAPGELGADGFFYQVQNGQILIADPGRGGQTLLLAGCAVTQGERGNLRPRAVLEQRGGYDGTEVEAVYSCPAPGRGGVSKETMETLRRRFSAGLRQVSAAVRGEDWEALVRQTPGLCIHKVKAAADSRRNLVRIAVKPYTEEKFPRLSEAYLNQLQAYLEPRRLLTVRFEICQPRYVPVAVHAALTVRGLRDRAREEADRLLRRTLDGIEGLRDFGGWIRFNELYQSLANLPFVEAVDALSLFPESRDAVLIGSDIRLEDDSLCYPGTIQLTVREQWR